jgi:hypothetical protein
MQAATGLRGVSVVTLRRCGRCEQVAMVELTKGLLLLLLCAAAATASMRNDIRGVPTGEQLPHQMGDPTLPFQIDGARPEQVCEFLSVAVAWGSACGDTMAPAVVNFACAVRTVGMLMPFWRACCVVSGLLSRVSFQFQQCVVC